MTASNRKVTRDVDSVARQVVEISTLPQIALQVIELTRNLDSRIDELENLIEGDPALAMKLLKTVNSSAYGLRQKITTLRQAISYLGFHAIRNLATTLSVSKVFEKDACIGGYQRAKLWRHMVSVGLCGRLVAEHCRVPNFEDANLAGLLHDIGIILEDQYDHDHFKQMLTNLKEGQGLAQQERQYLGYAHTLLGSRVAEAWKLPEFIQATIRFHHASQICPADHAPIVQSVEVANYMCSMRGITSIGLDLCTRPADEVFRSLDLCEADIEGLIPQLDEELEKNQALFQLL